MSKNTGTKVLSAAAHTKTNDSHSQLEECDCYRLLGLGRGVDITKRTPWLEKTSFQVREVKDVIETNEGGVLKYCEEEISSETKLHAELQGKGEVANIPLNLGIGAEYSRTYSSSRHVVGVQVKNRTISFRLDFADVPNSCANDVRGAKRRIEETRGNGEVGDDSRPMTTREANVREENKSLEPFEERLSKWLLDCSGLRKASLLALTGSGQSCKHILYDLIHKNYKSESEDILGIEANINNFVHHFGVTHYVSAIELGGLQYTVLTESQYGRRVAAGGAVSLNALAYAGLEVSGKTSQTKKMLDTMLERKEIGKIEDEKVKRENEAVIGVHLQPISSLVTNPYVQTAFRSAMTDYVQMKRTNKGPFLLTCGDDDIVYLKVQQENKYLVGTDSKEEAEEFTVEALNGIFFANELEFTLVSKLAKYKQKMYECRNSMEDLTRAGLQVSETDTVPHTLPDLKPLQSSAAEKASSSCTYEPSQPPLDYFLETIISPFTAKSASPPRMRLNPDVRDTRLLLKKRVDQSIPCDTAKWIKEQDAFYISCIHSFRNGFLCVKKTTHRQTAKDGAVKKSESSDAKGSESITSYDVSVVPSVEHHDDEKGMFMLFRLQPVDDLAIGTLTAPISVE